MTLPVELLPEAEAEIEAAFRWYERRRPGLGLEFVLAVDATFRRAAHRPFSYPKVLRRTRRAVLRRFPYLVYYVVEEDRILVTGVLHAGRDPRSRADRIRETGARCEPGLTLLAVS